MKAERAESECEWVRGMAVSLDRRKRFFKGIVGVLDGGAGGT